MSISDADIAFAKELFAPLGGVTHRKMFGGICLYRDGDIFALVSSEGQIYLKALGNVASTMADDGSSQFHNMPYWSLPDSALDDPEAACDLARISMASLS
ncbi:DNA transformation protein [Cognatiyoonia koreensis]|uniref:DNA transformation protein n=1 Tax=Cognatiyoonia koreensis TaxID=364200 RepID=A0A1I0PQE2_9RHOB|nr:TfoX/Sxy family protein [Cognatiyoonia koreensis]SEW16587.1 DNA transformation protein [Cognatiyoonia koreensis]